MLGYVFFFSSRRRHTRCSRDWSSDVCSSDLVTANAQSQVPAGARFLVELRDKLDAQRVKVGKKFEARAIEPIVAADGNSIPAWTKLKGQVSYVRDNQMVLRFDRIEPPGGKVPLVATVTGVVG